MDSQDLITKVTKIIPRDDGSEIRIVVEQMTGHGLNKSIGFYVHHRETPCHPWVYLNDRMHPDWRGMSVDDYDKHGRCEVLQAGHRGEVLNLARLIGKPMIYLQ